MPTPAPDLSDVRTCLDLARFARETLASLEACNADKRLVQDWGERMRVPE